jgi:hypothetical protein
VPGPDPAIELQDLRFQHPKLYAKGRHAGARHLGQAPIPWIAGHREQLRDASAADPCDDPELRHMGTDRVDHAGLLANEEMACPVEHEAGLLLRRLGLHEAHVRPRHRFTDGLSVGGIVLLPLDVGLHIGGRHQPHGMPQRPELARPMMRRGAGLHAHDAGC